MRLNRVLLLAASLSMLVSAMVFTISCSGDDGKDGKNGKNAECSAANSATGDAITITCDDGTTGTLRGNGPAGPQGPQGIPGPKGDPGIAGTLPDGICTLGKQDPTTGNWGITCGGHDIDSDISGEIVGCVNTANPNNPFQITLKCGTAEIYTCSGQYYTPTESECVPASVTDDAKFQQGQVKATNCGGVKFDSRTHFCDGTTLLELCGGARYAPAAPKSETCVGGQVTRACGNTRYIKATQFCMDGTTVTNRCGTKGADGVYSVGRGNDLDVVGTSTVQIKGEYSTAAKEICEDNKVVMKCGTASFEEATHFCAVNDVITKHCDDRAYFDPAQKFCSYVGNKNYKSTASGKACDDPINKPCQQYVSTPLPFCGTGTTNKYNDGDWKWEYCVIKDMGTGTSGASVLLSYSVMRCGVNMVPDDHPAGGAEAFSTCKCINAVSVGSAGGSTVGDYIPSNTLYSTVNAQLLGNTQNGCECRSSVGGPVKGYYAFADRELPSEITVNIGTTQSTMRVLGTNANIANGYPNAKGLGTNAVSALPSGKYEFFGGVCDNAPSCSATYPSLCNKTDCQATSLIWDPSAAKCVANEIDCIDGFGASEPNTAQCYTTEQDCGPANTTACKSMSTCLAATGYWDKYVTKNNCVKTAAKCNSGNATGKECNAPAAAVCDASHLALCTSSGDCTGATGFWDTYATANKCWAANTSCVNGSNAATSNVCDAPACGSNAAWNKPAQNCQCSSGYYGTATTAPTAATCTVCPGSGPVTSGGVFAAGQAACEQCGGTFNAGVSCVIP